MRWILSTDKEIMVDNKQVHARREYISDVTGVEVSAWSMIQVNGRAFYFCVSDDGINGTFITAHIHDVQMLCSLPDICACEFVVANTCVWHEGANKDILKRMKFINMNVELWFAKQELYSDGYILRQSTELNNVGQFRFQTSISERNLYRNRNKGFMNALQRSYFRVSPIIVCDYGLAL